MTHIVPDACAVPMGRNGVFLLWGILRELDAFCWFDDVNLHFTPEKERLRLNEAGRRFFSALNHAPLDHFDHVDPAAASARIRFSHQLDPEHFRLPLLRCVRDPRDMAVSLYDTDLKNDRFDQPLSMGEFLDYPMRPGTGTLCGFGPIEEWHLRERLLDEVSNPARARVVRFEDIKSDGPATIAGVAGFLGVPAGPSRIEQALERNRVETVKPFGRLSRSAGRPFFWKQAGHPELATRTALAAAALRPSTAYPSDPADAEEPAWPRAVFMAARATRVGNLLRFLKRRLGVSEFGGFPAALAQFYRLAGVSPLIEADLCIGLIQCGRHLEFARNILTSLMESNAGFPGEAAVILLSLLREDFRDEARRVLLRAHERWRPKMFGVYAALAGRVSVPLPPEIVSPGS